MQEPRKPFWPHLHDFVFPHSRNDNRPHLFRTISIAALVLVIVALEAGYLIQTRYVFRATDFLASVLPGALAALTNADRAALGLAGVAENAKLDAAAQAAARDMAAKGYFAHVSPEGVTPWQWLDQAGYRYSYAGQNLAMDFADSRAVEQAWMESPSHRANIVKREYTEVGFGTAQGTYEGRETTFVVEFFAAPATTAAPPPTVREVRLPSSDEGSLTSLTPRPVPSAAVLGSEIAPVRAASWVSRLLASPLHTVSAVFAALFALISVSFALTIIARGRVQHLGVIAGGIVLFALISGAMALNSFLAGRAALLTEAQPASVAASLED